MTATGAGEPGPFGLYIHWPYCAAICPYCDFNVYRDRGADRSALVDAICQDIRGWRERTGPRPLISLHFGGGTPSRLAAGDVARIVECAANAWTFEPDIEIGLEVNPEDADHGRFTSFRAAGVNRVSLGVQALSDEALVALGRAHSADEARRAALTAQSVFERVSIDLIYAREGQTPEQWERELSEAMSLGLEHLSLYQLTIEPGTAFERRMERGMLSPPDADRSADLFELTQERTAASGYLAYEVSNHAVSPEAQSQHNRLYWRSHEWAGVGPGAHGRLEALGGDRRALTAHRKPEDYIACVSMNGWGVDVEENLGSVDQAREMLMMGLRLTDGINLSRLRSLDTNAGRVDILASLQDDGLIACEGDRLRATSHGRAFIDRLALELAP